MLSEKCVHKYRGKLLEKRGERLTLSAVERRGYFSPPEIIYIYLVDCSNVYTSLLKFLGACYNKEYTVPSQYSLKRSIKV